MYLIFLLLLRLKYTTKGEVTWKSSFIHFWFIYPAWKYLFLIIISLTFSKFEYLIIILFFFQIAKDFFDWWTGLGNVEFKSEIKRPEDIEDLFQVYLLLFNIFRITQDSLNILVYIPVQ